MAVEMGAKAGVCFPDQKVQRYLAGRTTKGLPGLNIQFGPDDGWNRCIILSPQPSARVRGEVEIKAADLQKMIVIPNQVRGSGRRAMAMRKAGQ